jgi:hypothetical protein
MAQLKVSLAGEAHSRCYSRDLTSGDGQVRP